jgi:transcriptional regulator with XRE-family HTH domain
MKAVSQRIRLLREGINVPQTKLAELSGSTQSSINRYENGQSTPPLELLLWYADYFDVSMDYIFGRIDKPQGTRYSFVPQYSENNEQFKRFIEMCFDPSSPMNDKLNQTLFDMVTKGEGCRDQYRHLCPFFLAQPDRAVD